VVVALTLMHGVASRNNPGYFVAHLS